MIIGFKIRIKRDEIEIVKLLGASPWFIRFPFLLEGITYAIVGAFLGWLTSMSILWYFEPLLRNNLGEIAQKVLPISPLVMAEILLLEITVAIIVGGLGSLTALRRYLKL
jgi:cell division transport system permease protein